MSRKNVELVQGVLGGFIATGIPAWDLLDERVEVHDHDVMDAGEYRGHAGFGSWLENWDAAWSDFSMQPEEFLDGDQRIVSVFRMTATGRGSGVEVQRQDAIVWSVRDGKIVRLDYYNNREQALGSVGRQSRRRIKALGLRGRSR
jgi:ketosteroid isomerase-like protein